jgi:CRAL/TRIO domain
MAKHHQHGFYFTCKAGRPVYIERMGIMDPQKILEITTKEEIVRYYTKMHEKVMWVMLPVASKAAGKPIERCTNIFDMKGFSIFKMGKKVYDLISAASSMAQNNYPELLGAYKFFMDSDENF